MKFSLSALAYFALGSFPLLAAEGPGIPNVAYTQQQVGTSLSRIDPGKAVSTVVMHRGLMFVPLSADHGGGQGAGAFAFYNVGNPASPVKVFDSRDFPSLYHTAGGANYVGDWAEIHHLSASGDLFLIPERRGGSAGYCIFDIAPMYDDDPNTRPRVVSRYSFAGVTSPSNYDGFTFAPAWQGNRYLFAPTGAQGLYVIDTSNLSSPVEVARRSRASLGNITMRGAWAIGNMLILAEAAVQSQFQARIYDISNPTSPVQTGSFGGAFGYHGFVYGSSFYNAASPLERYDFTNPSNVIKTTLASPVFDRPEYGFGKDGHVFVGHYPGALRFALNGNSASLAATVNSGLVDDHAFLNPLGNLLAMCSDHNNDRKIMICVASTAADSQPPQSLFTSPADGAVGQNVLSRVGISFSDWVDPKSVNASTITIRNLSTGVIVSGSFSVMMGIVNFVPSSPLALDTTYEVMLKANGVKDQAGNAVPADLRVCRFSTGSQIVDFQSSLQRTTPVLVGETVQLALTVVNPSGLTLEHSWNFGDGSADTPFTSSTTASHAFSSKGNHSVSVRSRIAGTTQSAAISGVQVVHGPIAATPPRVQSTILFDPDHSKVWNVNPDHDSVTAIGSTTLVRIHEIPVGDQPVALALGSQDRLWVVNKKSGSLSVIHRATGTLTATHALPAGCEPHGLIADPVEGVVYVSMESLGEVAKVRESDGEILTRISVGPTPRGLSLDPQRGILWVSRFISPDQGGEVVPVDLATFTALPRVPLAPVMQADGLQNGRGIPNYVAAVTLSPDLDQAFIPSKKDNMFRGLTRDGQPLTFEHSVRSMAANLHLATRSENPTATLDFDNSDFATAAAFSPLGNMVFFTTSGSATIWAVDAYDPTSSYTFSSGGRAPDGLAVSADGTKLFVHNFMDRSVTVFQSSAACGSVCGTAPQVAKITTVSSEALAPQILRGKQLFYDASDPRMAQEGYMSCASCHPDGGHDGRVWDFTNFGEGLRNTIDLNGKGSGHGALHWTGNFDEVHDFEGQIRGFSQALGLMENSAFHQGTRSLPLGESKTGISSDLDGLAAYVQSLTSVGISPRRAADGNLSSSAAAGRQIFMAENCASCHGGSAFTNSASSSRHDVGTLKSTSGNRLGDSLDGLDTPTLRGLWKSAPYLHDGSAATLESVLTTHDRSGRHGGLFHRSSQEIAQLVEYLESIDDLETAAPYSVGTDPVIAPQGPLQHPVHRALTVDLSATGQEPLVWSAISLPAGLEIDAVSGTITGSPSAAGDFTARIGVRDAAGRFASLDLDWSITDSTSHRYVKLVTYSSQNGQPFSSLAEFNLLGRDGQALDRTGWQVSASTQELTAESGQASRVIDGQNNTHWHSAYSAGASAFPHELVVDLGTARSVHGFTCLPRQDGQSNGRIKSFAFFFSDDGVSWGSPVALGQFPDGSTLQTAWLHSISSRYVKLVSLSGHGAFSLSSMAEFNLLDAGGTPLSRSGWQASASSVETSQENGAASRAIDGSTSTYWHTVWSGVVPPFPHEFIVDLGSTRIFHGFSQLPRQGGNTNGWMKDFRFQHSNDGINWSAPVAYGSFANTSAVKSVMLGNFTNRQPVLAAPVIAFSVPENAAPGSLVGTVTASDPDPGQSLVYSLGSGNPYTAFTIHPQSGEIRVADALSYESQPIHQLQVIATDDGSPALSSSRTYPITISNLIESNTEAVMIHLSAPGGPYEGQGNPALVGFSADPDSDGTPNAIEILLGTDPSQPNAQPPIRPVTVEHLGQTWIAYEYDLPSDSNLSAVIMGSDDLQQWTPLINSPTLHASQGNLRTWRVMENQPLSGSRKRFVRLDVSP